METERVNPSPADLRAIASAVLHDERGTLSREARRSLQEQTDDDRSRTLSCLLSPLIGKGFNRGTLTKIDEITKRYAEFLARHGIAFPQLTAIIYEQRGWIELVRADLDEGGIQVVVRNAIVRFPDITGRELAEAIHNTFPSYRPSAVVNQTEWEKSRRVVV